MKNHYEILSAKKYYGKHAIGTVLLVNGSVEFHGDRKDINKILRRQKNKGLNMKKYNCYIDPGHGWLRVHKKELIGIENKISSCSYMRGDYVYLEEDGDLTLFIKDKNIDTSNFVYHHTNKSSKIRGYNSYQAYTEKEKNEISELKKLMKACKKWSKKVINSIENASLKDLKYWRSIYNF